MFCLAAGNLGIHTVQDEFFADWKRTSLPLGFEMVEIKANENLLVAHSIKSNNPDSWHTFVCGDNNFSQTGIKRCEKVSILEDISRLKDIEPTQHTIRVEASDEHSFVLVQDYDLRWWKCGSCGGQFQLNKGYNCCMSCKEFVTDKTQLSDTNTWAHNPPDQSQASSGPGGPSLGQAAAVPGNPSSSETTEVSQTVV